MRADGLRGALLLLGVTYALCSLVLLYRMPGMEQSHNTPKGKPGSPGVVVGGLPGVEKPREAREDRSMDPVGGREAARREPPVKVNQAASGGSGGIGQAAGGRDGEGALGTDSPAPVAASRPPVRAPVSKKVMVFYYAWYDGPTKEQPTRKWRHWNHELLNDWKKPSRAPLGHLGLEVARQHDPEQEDLGSSFYPALGPYSSPDEHIIDAHMEHMARAGVGVVCHSWYPEHESDEQLADMPGFSDRVTMSILDAAQRHGLEVAFHLEPYESRTAASVRDDLGEIVAKYGRHAALHRGTAGRPFVYVYDSYHTAKTDWAKLLTEGGEFSVRGTDRDCVAIALMVEENRDRDLVLAGGFDGFYTYFAADGFTQGSTTRRWAGLGKWAESNGLLFVPSVGPGYDDLRIRPWNAENLREREEGRYYDRMWEAALASQPALVSVTSFNEWHEGTQIEPAVPKAIHVTNVATDVRRKSNGRVAVTMEAGGAYSYQDYLPLDPFFYLDRTRVWAERMDPSAFASGY